MSQAAVVAALADPATYAHRPARVEHLQTHISHVFLAGPHVYKLKKAVVFPFLDFGTAARRRHFCEEEVRLNRRLCPEVYLDVLPVVREALGRVRLDGDGEVLDHVVWMRRLPADRLLPALLARNRVLPEMMDALAAKLAAFHAAAPAGPEVAAEATPERLATQWRDNLADGARFAGEFLAAADHEILADFGPGFARTHETLLRARVHGGRIRDGHGDLHADHVCFVDAAAPGELPAGIYVFDCIEFAPAFRRGDVAAEVAFLVMDLERRGHPDLGDRFAAAYAAAASDADLERLLPFYGCARACVRGKVEGLAALEPEIDAAAREAAAARARGYFALALRYAWRAGGPALIAVGGLSGTGKTTLAAALADATGFVHLSTDALRRRPGTSGPAAYGEGGYTAEARAAVYATLAAETEAALAAGRGVIADATFIRRADRDRLAAAARRERRPHVFVVCHADDAAVRARLATRTRDGSLSDARWETYLGQRHELESPGDDEPHVGVDTGGHPDAARAAALRALWRWRQQHHPP